MIISINNKLKEDDRLKCPYCGFLESKVIESRAADEGEKVRRRRECMECGRRFTTYEMVENIPIMVVKKDGSRELFNREKLLNGILRACEKRPVSIDKIESAVDIIESKIQNSLEREISSQYVGECTMDALRDIDEIAYIRFASVYRQFKDVNTFMLELKKLLG